MKEHLKNISEIVSDIIMKYTDYTNGYGTQIDGVVNRNKKYFLKIHLLPIAYNVIDNCKYDELKLKEIGYELYEAISVYLFRNSINSEIIIQSKHIEYGAYNTIISHTETVSVNFKKNK